MAERNSRGRFSEEFKRSMVSAIEFGVYSCAEVEKRYEIRGHSTISKWCRRYGGNQTTIMSNQRKEEHPSLKDDQVLLLQNQVKVLEWELREARLKQATLETLIDIAERNLSVDIKKNFGGKQSAR
jgi:transposase